MVDNGTLVCEYCGRTGEDVTELDVTGPTDKDAVLIVICDDCYRTNYTGKNRR
jgi:predicted Fe-S protein YdhL (DUF1289 family)